MSLTKNQLELLKIAKSLVGMVLDQDKALAQDEEENLTHVKRLLDWHTSHLRIVPGKTIVFEKAEEVVYDSLMKHMKAPAYPDCPNDKHNGCVFCETPSQAADINERLRAFFKNET